MLYRSGICSWKMQLEYAAGICSWNMPERSNHTIVRQTIPRYRNHSKMLQDWNTIRLDYNYRTVSVACFLFVGLVCCVLCFVFCVCVLKMWELKGLGSAVGMGFQLGWPRLAVSSSLSSTEPGGGGERETQNSSVAPDCLQPLLCTIALENDNGRHN